MPARTHTVSAWRERGVIGLEISFCSHCGAATKATWEDMNANDSEDVVDVLDRELRCDLCGLTAQESDVAGSREGALCKV